MFARFKKFLGNIPGWRTDRKLVLFLVDDYGSIRMSSQRTFDLLLKAGVNLSSCRYNRLETLESNADLEGLFETLTGHRDSHGNYPVFTPLVCVANPDFARIEAEGFRSYHYQPFTETLKQYPDHDRVYDLWMEGISKKVFVPQFHGREHLNVKHWMDDLLRGVRTPRLAFDYGVTGIGPHQANDIHYDYQAAFDFDSKEDLIDLSRILQDGLRLFELLLGYRACFFTPTNGLFSRQLDSALHQGGVTLINVGKVNWEPFGGGRYKRHFHYMGQRNRFDQKFIVRTAQFEPSEPGNIDWVDKCLADIDCAFRLKKPALISSHRVNFCGHLVPKNRDRGLKQLDCLIREILKHWPDAEFISMRDFEPLIRSSVDV